MAHELSLRTDGSAEMAYVGELPWHGLGKSVTKGASIGVWQKEAGMAWDAKESRVFYEHPVEAKLTGKDNGNKLDIVESHKVIYRGDTGAALGVVGTKYNVVQPKEVLEFFRDLTEGGGWHIHTAGVLRGGRKLWAMASNDQSSAIGTKKGTKGIDWVRHNLLLATSLDGSMKTIARPTAVRVVCANTLGLALSEAGQAVQISHRSIFDAQAVKRALGVARESFDVFMEQAREMSETPIELDEALDVLRKVFGAPAPIAKPVSLAWMGDLSKLADNIAAEDQEDDTKESRVTSRVLELFAGAGMGADMRGSKGTRWGLFNAVTQHIDHEMGRSDDTRLDSAWFGRGDSFKQAALAELVEEKA